MNDQALKTVDLKMTEHQLGDTTYEADFLMKPSGFILKDAVHSMTLNSPTSIGRRKKMLNNTQVGTLKLDLGTENNSTAE